MTKVIWSHEVPQWIQKFRARGGIATFAAICDCASDMRGLGDLSDVLKHAVWEATRVSAGAGLLQVINHHGRSNANRVHRPRTTACASRSLIFSFKNCLEMVSEGWGYWRSSMI